MSLITLPADLEDLARSWLRHTLKQGDEPQSWEQSRALAEHDPEHAWQLTLALIERLPAHLLDHVGANVLEHILEYHAQSFVDRVEVQARVDQRFQACLSTVWLVDDDAPAAVLDRLRVAAGGHLEIMPRAELERLEREYDGGA